MSHSLRFACFVLFIFQISQGTSPELNEYCFTARCICTAWQRTLNLRCMLFIYLNEFGSAYTVRSESALNRFNLFKWAWQCTFSARCICAASMQAPCSCMCTAWQHALHIILCAVYIWHALPNCTECALYMALPRGEGSHAQPWPDLTLIHVFVCVFSHALPWPDLTLSDPDLCLCVCVFSHA